MADVHADDAIKPLAVKDNDSLSMFVKDIKKYPMLEADEEFQLATDWQRSRDDKAAEKLLTSHLRLVHKVAQGYRGYGLALHDMVAEGNIGLMQALSKFDPSKGFRFSTYAVWWIRAAIQEHVLKNWSLVKIGTTAAQKKLFFNFKRLRAELNEDDHLSDDAVQKIADKLKVTRKEVSDISQRIVAQDYSLNTFAGTDGDNQWQDWLECPDDNQEKRYGEQQEMKQRQGLLDKSMASLNAREHGIIKFRRLHEPPKTLEELSIHYSLSKERVRQIEVSAFQKLQAEMRKHAEDQIYH